MLHRVRSAIRALGWREALFYGISRLIQRWTGATPLYRYAIVAQPIAGQDLVPSHRGREIVVRLFTSSDPILEAFELDRHLLEYRFHQHAVCFAAFHRERPAGCLWLSLGPFEEDEVRCRFEPQPEGRACWDLGVYVVPQQRGGIVFARLWSEANAYLRLRGINWTLSRISTANLGSLASHASLGARRIGSATFLRLGDAQLMISSLAPFLYLALSRADRPILRPRAPRASEARL
jgi:hypothetical protein